MNLKQFAVSATLLMVFGGCQTIDQIRPDYALRRNPSEQVSANPAALRRPSDSRNKGKLTEGSPSYFDSVASESASHPGPAQQVQFLENIDAQDGFVGALSEIEQLALDNSPAIQQIRTEIEGLDGKLQQAGLGANPVVGISGQEINEDGGAGRYGVYFGRQVIRPEKLYLASSAVEAEIEAANQRLMITEQKLLTDVRQRYFQLLVARERVSVSKRLVSVAEKAVETSKKLKEADEAAQTSVLQSELELQNAEVNLKRAENERQAAKRRLNGFLGDDFRLPDELDVNLEEFVDVGEFENTLEELVNNSPEIAALFADVETARRQLDRENVEALPNVTWQTNLLYDMVGDNMVVGFQLGMPIPSVNWNQGNIYKAQQQVTTAQLKVEKRSQELLQRLAGAYESYLDAKIQVDAFKSEILPKAKETFDLISLGFSEGEITYLQLLTAQRTFTQTNLNYIESLSDLWRHNVNIRGLLLSGSLE